MRTDFLRVLDQLRAVAADGKDGRDASIVIEVWEVFGTIAGLTEGELRAEAMVECQKTRSRRGLKSCAWFKCVMYGREDESIVRFRCAGCRQGMYCSVLCQER